MSDTNFDYQTRLDALDLIVRSLLSTLSPEQLEKFMAINSATLKAFRESPNLNFDQESQAENIAAAAEAMLDHLHD